MKNLGAIAAVSIVAAGCLAMGVLGSLNCFSLEQTTRIAMMVSGFAIPTIVLIAALVYRYKKDSKTPIPATRLPATTTTPAAFTALGMPSARGTAGTHNPPTQPVTAISAAPEPSQVPVRQLGRKTVGSDPCLVALLEEAGMANVKTREFPKIEAPSDLKLGFRIGRCEDIQKLAQMDGVSQTEISIVDCPNRPHTDTTLYFPKIRMFLTRGEYVSAPILVYQLYIAENGFEGHTPNSRKETRPQLIKLIQLELNSTGPVSDDAVRQLLNS